MGADGTASLVWTDCGLRPTCTGNDVVVSTSRDDGLTWTGPTRIPTGLRSDYELPGFAVDPANPRRLALVYYSYVDALDAWLVTSMAGTLWLLRKKNCPIG